MDLKETHTNTHTHTQAYRCSWTEAILRNQVRAGHRLAHAWFNKSLITQLYLLPKLFGIKKHYGVLILYQLPLFLDMTVYRFHH